jgi:hypothetical protein
MIAVAITIPVIPVTTADVVANPTPAVFLSHFMPLKHPAIAIITPKTKLWISPIHT